MKKILELITQYDGKLYDLCYKLLSENENHSEIFQFVCENLVKELPDKPVIQIKKYFKKSDINEYEIVYANLIEGIISSTIKKCDYEVIKPENFYKAVWERYCINFTSLKEKAFAFYYTLLDDNIPYINIGKPLNMDNRKYKEVVEKNEENIKKIFNILFNSLYRQKTEVASLILKSINDIDDYESKVVVLSKALEISYLKRTGIDSTGLR